MLAVFTSLDRRLFFCKEVMIMLKERQTTRTITIEVEAKPEPCNCIPEQTPQSQKDLENHLLEELGYSVPKPKQPLNWGRYSDRNAI
jgi:hypothetical protein